MTEQQFIYWLKGAIQNELQHNKTPFLTDVNNKLNSLTESTNKQSSRQVLLDQKSQGTKFVIG